VRNRACLPNEQSEQALSICNIEKTEYVADDLLSCINDYICFRFRSSGKDKPLPLQHFTMENPLFDSPRPFRNPSGIVKKFLPEVRIFAEMSAQPYLSSLFV